jgi:hypothetical protein
MAIARRNLIMTPWLTAKVILVLNLAQCDRTCDCIIAGTQAGCLDLPATRRSNLCYRAMAARGGESLRFNARCNGIVA